MANKLCPDHQWLAGSNVGECAGCLARERDKLRSYNEADAKTIAEMDADRNRIVADAHQMTQDLQQIVQELGIGARPYSGHEAMERVILPEIRRLRQVEAVYESIMTRKVPRSYIGNPIPSAMSEKEREWRNG